MPKFKQNKLEGELTLEISILNHHLENIRNAENNFREAVVEYKKKS
jgi:hypothetical protein